MPYQNQSLSLCWGSMENVPLDEHIRCAAHAGFDAITVSPGAYSKAIAHGFSDASLNELLEENGVQVTGFDPILSWVSGAPTLDGDEDFAIATRTSVEECVRIASALHCPLINVPPGLVDSDIDTYTRSFVDACDIAADQQLQVALEFLPFSPINNLDVAWQIVQRADRPNGGIMLDSWHFYQSGGQPGDLDKVPAEKISAIQLNGVTACKPEDWIDQTMNARLQPDQGDYDVAAMVRKLREHGVQGIYDVEVFSKALRALPAKQRAEQCYRGACAMLDCV